MMKKLTILSIAILLCTHSAVMAFMYASSYCMETGIHFPKTGSAFPVIGGTVRFSLSESFVLVSSVDFAPRDFEFERPVAVELDGCEYDVSTGLDYRIREIDFFNVHVSGRLGYKILDVDNFSFLNTSYDVDPEGGLFCEFGIHGEYRLNRQLILGTSLGFEIGGDIDLVGKNGSSRFPAPIENRTFKLGFQLHYVPPRSIQ